MCTRDYSWLQYLLRLRYIWSRVPGKRKFNQLTALLVFRGMCVCVCMYLGGVLGGCFACMLDQQSLPARFSFPGLSYLSYLYLLRDSCVGTIARGLCHIIHHPLATGHGIAVDSTILHSLIGAAFLSPAA